MCAHVLMLQKKHAVLSPRKAMIFCVNGRFIPERRAVVSVLDNGFLYGDGFYDTLRTYDGVVLDLDLHLKRIERSAHIMGYVLPWSMHTIGRWIRAVSEKNRLGDAKIRVTVTRGPHGITFAEEKKPTLVITCAKLRPAPAIYRKGVAACTMQLQRVWPDVKTTGLAAMILADRYAALHKAYEAICLGTRGLVREGGSTNVFIVRRGVVLTPKSAILRGQTRQTVLTLAHRLGLPVRIRDFGKTMLRSADEIFLTNRVREIIPVVRLNGKKVGTGKPGPLTKKLMAAYQEYIRAYVAKNRAS